MSETLDRHQRVRALFERVRDLPPAERTAALVDACDGDSTLHDDVAQLLVADAEAGSFLEHGAAAALANTYRLAGRRLGPYEIQASIGAGGMGEVYRARDTTLRRDVALKILPELYANDLD